MIELLNTLDLLFKGGEILHDEELNLIVSHINDVVGRINSTIIPAIENIHDGIDGQNGQDGRDGQNGKDGLEGISSLNAFVGAGDAAEALLKLGNRSLEVYPPGLYSIGSNVLINSGEVLFMTSARRRGENDWIFGEDNYIWSIPVLLGVGNTTSTTGVDTDEFNYIYCRTFRNVDAVYTSQASLLSIIMNYIEEHPGSGVKVVNNQLSYVIDLDNDTNANINGAWTDHPYGINETFPHEWMVGYKKNEQDLWEYYFGPIMISNYGFNGLDGDGYEYIFARNDTKNSAPSIDYTANNNKTRNDDDFIPLGWTDEPLGVSDNTGCHYEWVATRKKFGNPAVWHDFSPPSIWGLYAAPGKLGLYRQWAYKNAVSIESNEIPESNNVYPPNGWASTASTPDFAKGEYTWCIDRIVTFDANNQPVYGNWSNPYRITGNSGLGNMYYPAGEYNSLIEYTRNNNVCPIVHYTDPNNVDSGYWYLNSSTNIVNNEHIAPSSTLDNPWKKAENYGMVITEVLFTQFAKLGSFIVSGDFFISQHGTLFKDSGEVEITSSRTEGNVYTLNNIPYLALSTDDIACYNYFDSLDPMVETLPTYGNYKFRPTKVINAKTGEEWMAEGKIHIDSNGNAKFQGKIITNEGIIGGFKITSNTIESMDSNKNIIFDSQNNIAKIKGEFNALLFYSPTVRLDEGEHDLSQNLAHTYLLGAIQGSTCYADLPNAEDFDGIEFQFFSPILTRTISGAVYIRSNSNIYYLNNSSNLYDYSRLLYPRQSLVTIKSMGNAWWVISGDVSNAES